MRDQLKYLFVHGGLVPHAIWGATYPDSGSTYSRPPHAFHLQVGGGGMQLQGFTGRYRLKHSSI